MPRMPIPITLSPALRKGSQEGFQYQSSLRKLLNPPRSPFFKTLFVLPMDFALTSVVAVFPLS
jgi:hypothetical protein